MWVREFPLIEYQIFGRCYKVFLGEKIKLPARTVIIIKDGLGEIYRNPKLAEIVNGIILAKTKDDKDFLTKFLIDSTTLLEKLERTMASDNGTRAQLLEFIDDLSKFWPAIYAAIFVPLSDKFTDTERKTFLNFRKRIELLEHDAHHYIERSLVNIYPEIGNLAWAMSLEDLESGKIDPDVFKKRAKKPIIVVDDEIVGAKEFEYLKIQGNYNLEKRVDLSGIKEVSGQVGYPGNVRGAAKVIYRERDLGKMQDGNILVCQMTLPTYISAMKKAAAFVTDEGGITCHAAIVARELKKPCIIGTKHATQVLKDGDMVEVDAERGIVRKIK